MFLVKDAINIVPFLMYASGDLVVLTAGLTVTCTISKNGGAFGAISGTVAEVGSGMYKVTLAAADCNTYGAVALKFVAATSTTKIDLHVCGLLDITTVNFGITALPTAAFTSAGGLLGSANATPSHLAWVTSAGYVRVAINGDKSGYTLDPSGANGITTIRDSVWNATLASYASAGTAGKKLTDILADVWTTLIPASYGAGTAGKKVGDNLDAPVSNASTLTIADVTTGANAALDSVGTELSVVPSTTGTLRRKIDFLFQYFRNKRTMTSSVETLYKEDASTSLGTSTVSDNGTTFTKGETN